MLALTSRARSVGLKAVLLPLIVLVFVPQVLDLGLLAAATLGLIYAIACVGLDLFSGYGGQLAFGNYAFVAIGAYTSASLSTDHGWPIWGTLPAAILTTAIAGFLLAMPAVKVPSLAGALVTLFFAYTVFELLLGQTLVDVTHSADGIAVQPLTIGGSFLTYQSLYYACLATLGVVLLAGWRYANSRPGIELRVIKRSPAVAAANAISVDGSRRAAMTFSAATAGVAGFLYAQVAVYLSPESFTTLMSVNLVAMAVLGGFGSVIGPVYGALAFALINSGTSGGGTWVPAVFPVLLLVALIAFPQGMYGLGEPLARLLRRMQPNTTDKPKPAAAQVTASPNTPVATVPSTPRPRSKRNPDPNTETLLEVDDISVRFGGVAAIDGVSMSVARGSIHGIIGPNGAGKTTLLNCISGAQRCDGDIRFDGRSIMGQSSRTRSRAGIARTFQAPSLVPDLTVVENVTVGAYLPIPRHTLQGYLPTGRARKAQRQARDAALQALRMLAFPETRWDVLASDLTLAEQKTIDVARAIAGTPALVLMDEPTAGLDEEGMQDMARAVQVVQEGGATVVVIAHHVGFLRSIADELTVLDFGRNVTNGDPKDVLDDPTVIDIYLGGVNA